MTISPDCEAYIRERFKNSEVRTDPFPHLVIENILPPGVYDEMKRNTPPAWYCDILWKLQLLKKLKSRKILREQLHFALGENNRSSFGLGKKEVIWQRYKGIIALIDQLTIDSFGPWIDRYLHALQDHGILKGKPSLVPGQAIFCHRSTGWDISPHVHNLSQLIQTMIYFPLPGSTEDQGTIMYRLRGRPAVEPSTLETTMQFATEFIEPTTQIPYRANSMISWLNTPVSVHASSRVSKPNRRYTFTAVAIHGDLDFSGQELPLDAFN
jgi:hypothetical protein